MQNMGCFSAWGRLLTLDSSVKCQELTPTTYGNVTAETNSAVDTLFGYTGRFFDEDTGLQWNLNRWYDPVVGRFVSVDPIGFAAGDPNLYRYTGNSPGDSVDPDGLRGGSSGYVRTNIYRQGSQPNGPRPNSGPQATQPYSPGSPGHPFNAAGGLRSERTHSPCVEEIGQALRSRRRAVQIRFQRDTARRAYESFSRRQSEVKEEIARYRDNLIRSGVKRQALDRIQTDLHNTIRRIATERDHARISRDSREAIQWIRAVREGRVQARDLTRSEHMRFREMYRDALSTLSRQHGSCEPGQVHHVISAGVHRALERHPILRGQYQSRDSRFTTRAANKEAHNGYQKWHRQLDREVESWIKDPVNKSTTPQQFEGWLRWRYSQPDLLERFPDGH